MYIRCQFGRCVPIQGAVTNFAFVQMFGSLSRIRWRTGQHITTSGVMNPNPESTDIVSLALFDLDAVGGLQVLALGEQVRLEH